MLAHVPAWVFVLLALLLALGLTQTREREVSPQRPFLIAAAMLGYSLWGVWSMFGVAWAPLICWAAGVGLVSAFAQTGLFSRGVHSVPGRGTVRLPGSWIPLGLILCIFSVKFFLGVAAGTGHAVPPASFQAALAALILGLCSGGFVARASAVWKASRSERGAHGAARA